jgi:hypothetical protein
MVRVPVMSEPFGAYPRKDLFIYESKQASAMSPANDPKVHWNKDRVHILFSYDTEDTQARHNSRVKLSSIIEALPSSIHREMAVPPDGAASGCNMMEPVRRAPLTASFKPADRQATEPRTCVPLYIINN